jgi:TPR repeat protein
MRAEQGDVRAQDHLASMYYYGRGVPQDYTEAVRWYRKAAEQGDVTAQQNLGYMFYSGQGVQQDDTQAVAWYRKAAEQGDTEAQQSLGYMYANGRGVPRDYSEAVRWYLKAADQGNTKAKRALESLESGSRPPMKTRYIEISAALLGFPVGLWLSLDFLLPGRRLRDWRQSAITLLGVTFLLNAGLSLYAFAHDIRYSPYHDAFHLARTFLVVIAILIIVTVILPAKKKPNRTQA